MMNSRKQQLIILGGVFVAVIILLVLATLLMPKKITLSAVPANIDTISINGQEQSFTEGMQIDYNAPVTLVVKKTGYSDYTVTLDPGQQKIQQYTIVLSESRTGTDTSPNAQIIDQLPSVDTSRPADIVSREDILLQAAVNGNKHTLLDFGDALSVKIVDFTQVGDYYAYTVQHTAGEGGDTALVVVKVTDQLAQIELGPGTVFSPQQVNLLPQAIADFAQSRGYVSDL